MSFRYVGCTALIHNLSKYLYSPLETNCEGTVKKIGHSILSGLDGWLYFVSANLHIFPTLQV